MSGESAVPVLDLRGTPCPINFIRTKLKLAQMPPGALLEVWLDPGEPIEQVPDSLVMEGYKIDALVETSGFYTLTVRQSLTGQNGQDGSCCDG
ncbi:MAG: sulfurtransferase TusA family protein [Prochlorotrichaceae cyanobacterium]|jgi:TusA-related sulfurtransferase